MVPSLAKLNLIKEIFYVRSFYVIQWLLFVIAMAPSLASNFIVALDVMAPSLASNFIVNLDVMAPSLTTKLHSFCIFFSFYLQLFHEVYHLFINFLKISMMELIKF
jgi:hypothetical protein